MLKWNPFINIFCVGAVVCFGRVATAFVLYGYIIFVSESRIDNNVIYKDIVNILIDYIN